MRKPGDLLELFAVLSARLWRGGMPGLREYGRGSQWAAAAVQFLKSAMWTAESPLAAVRGKCALSLARTVNNNRYPPSPSGYRLSVIAGTFEKTVLIPMRHGWNLDKHGELSAVPPEKGGYTVW